MIKCGTDIIEIARIKDAIEKERFKERVYTEKEIGYSILKDKFLEELEPKFSKMKCQGIIPSEKINPQKFWSKVEKELQAIGQISWLPCECSF